MTDFILGGREQLDVAIIGGGPAGLAAATELKRRNVSRVVVLEREPDAGGIPRHCGHPPFGMREFKRVLTGPNYAKRLVEKALKAGVEIHTDTTVVEARPEGELCLTTNSGMEEVRARRVIYATGVRETPRSARLVSGSRPQGVLNTGALQSMIYLKGQIPFKRPVIIGTELVSFSAIMTCRHAGIRPVAMIEENDQVTARWPSALFPRLVGIPLHLSTRLISIKGENKVEGVVVEEANGKQRSIDCNGVILTGRFTPEASLGLCGHLLIDTASGGPAVDQYGRCSDPAYFATGNLLRPVETAGWSWNEGRKTGRWVADDLAGTLPACEGELQITSSDPLIKFHMPQKITMPHTQLGMECLQLRVSHSAKGHLKAISDKGTIWEQKMSVKPERRILVPLKELAVNSNGNPIELIFTKEKL